MSPEAQAAADAFYATLQAKGKRVDQAQLEEAWEQAAKAALKLGGVRVAHSKSEWKRLTAQGVAALPPEIK